MNAHSDAQIRMKDLLQARRQGEESEHCGWAPFHGGAPSGSSQQPAGDVPLQVEDGLREADESPGSTSRR